MKLICKRRNNYSLFFAVSVCLVVWLGVELIVEVVYVFGALSIISLILLVRQSRLLYDAGLIWDNRILAVPSAFISTAGSKEKNDAEETLVSTFGILIGSKIYKWGMDGVRGVRLKAIKIDRMQIYLTFGNVAETMQVELLHGMGNKQVVLEVKQKLWRETGVEAMIIGW